MLQFSQQDEYDYYCYEAKGNPERIYDIIRMQNADHMMKYHPDKQIIEYFINTNCQIGLDKLLQLAGIQQYNYQGQANCQINCSQQYIYLSQNLLEVLLVWLTILKDINWNHGNLQTKNLIVQFDNDTITLILINFRDFYNDHLSRDKEYQELDRTSLEEIMGQIKKLRGEEINHQYARFGKFLAHTQLYDRQIRDSNSSSLQILQSPQTILEKYLFFKIRQSFFYGDQSNANELRQPLELYRKTIQKISDEISTLWINKIQTIKERLKLPNKQQMIVKQDILSFFNRLLDETIIQKSFINDIDSFTKLTEDQLKQSVEIIIPRVREYMIEQFFEKEQVSEILFKQPKFEFIKSRNQLETEIKKEIKSVFDEMCQNQGGQYDPSLRAYTLQEQLKRQAELVQRKFDDFQKKALDSLSKQITANFVLGQPIEFSEEEMLDVFEHYINYTEKQILDKLKQKGYKEGFLQTKIIEVAEDYFKKYGNQKIEELMLRKLEQQLLQTLKQYRYE